MQLEQQLSRFFTAMNCRSLGDGNLAAGVNTLISMCSTLAAVAGPDAAISGKSRTYHVGQHWLVCGPLLPHLHEEVVLQPLRDLQNVLSRNAFLARSKYDNADMALRPMTGAGTPHPQPVLASESAVTQADRQLIRDISRDDTASWMSFDASSLLQVGSLSDRPEVLRRPLVLLAGSNPAMLSTQLQQAHRAYPLVDFVVDTRETAGFSASACKGIMDGCLVAEPHPVQIRGIVTARLTGKLSEIACDRDALAWMRRALWLVGQGWKVQNVGEVPVLDDIHERYRTALQGLLTKRLNGEPTHYSFPEFGSFQSAYLRHLQEREKDFPGISGTQRKAMATLVFGLIALVNASAVPKGFLVDWHGVLVATTRLVSRMITAYESATESVERERRRGLMDSILNRLENGPHSERDLTRRFNKLPIGQCRELVRELERLGRIHRLEDGRWALIRETKIIEG